MINLQPSKTFRGNVEEVFSHKDEIPAGAFLELRVYEPKPETEDEPGDFGGKTAADMIEEIGFVHGGPPDLSTNPKYMEGFGETTNRRSLLLKALSCPLRHTSSRSVLAPPLKERPASEVKTPEGA